MASPVFPRTQHRSAGRLGIRLKWRSHNRPALAPLGPPPRRVPFRISKLPVFPPVRTTPFPL